MKAYFFIVLVWVQVLSLMLAFFRISHIFSENWVDEVLVIQG